MRSSASPEYEYEPEPEREPATPELRPEDPDTNEYVKCMYDAYGEERAEEILGVNLHHSLI